MKYFASDLKNWETERRSTDGTWVPCRPINWKFESFRQRLKHAWGVLKGKYDVVEWDEE